MKEIELIGKRGAREKHFLKENGIITANVYDEDIHFLKDGKYEEIDNTLIEENGYLVNKNNAYKVHFAKKSKDELMKINIGNNYIKTKLIYQKGVNVKENIIESKLHKNVCYPNIIENVDLEYNIMPGKVKEAIILKNKNVDLEKLVFLIETNTKLELKENKKIISTVANNNCFEFDALYMIDANFKTNNNINYKLTKIDDYIYQLELIIDKEWLYNEETKYPVIIDPTITNSGQNNSVYDTYIYPGDSGVDRNSQDILKVGVEKVNGSDRVNRALIKFDLPTIGTGSQVISAELNLWGYPDISSPYESDIVTVHQITSDWNESSADWNTMNDKYNSLVEGMIEARRGYYNFEEQTITPAYCGCDITRLVRKWYTGIPNYGLMLKLNEEKYNEKILPAFYSKNNNLLENEIKPKLIISYRNQNGILNYMNYQEQEFISGNTYVNNYNGNLTTIFDIGRTINGKMPVELKLIYNTNDVVLNNNYGYGLGYKLNLHQTIREQQIDGKTYLEYNDEDGTLHYFLNQKTTFDDTGYNTSDTGNVFYDEDGLDMNIEKNSDNYILKDKKGNIKKFIKNGNIAYLSEIEDTSGNKNIITYNSNNLIVKILDANNSEINISYENNLTKIVSSNETIKLNYLNNKLVSINDLLGVTSFEYNENDIISKITDSSCIRTSYEYYSQIPYKIKKVSQYGMENTLGEYFELIYGFDSTTIIDSKGNVKNIVFNSQGSVVSTSVFENKESLKNAYGISEVNGTNDGTNPGYNNKLLKAEVPIGYVKNLLLNTSFESNFNYFTSGPYSTITISDEVSNTGEKSLKVVSDTYDNQVISYSANLELEKGKYYTFSCYVKSTNKLKLQLRYLDKDNNNVEVQSDVINPSNEFDRHDVTIHYPEDANSGLLLRINTLEKGTLYIDDIQLEEGEVANNYNLLENSDFSNGLSEWILDAYDPNTGNSVSTNDKFEVVSLNNGIKALKIKKNPAYDLSMEKTFNISGRGGDVFNISFWYKNFGILSNLTPDYGSRIYIDFNYIDQENGHCGIPSPQLNPNDEAWQYVSNDFTAEKDYNSITVNFYHTYDANDLYITNISLFKDIRSVYYEYDENGNVILENNLDDKKSNYNYNKDNLLIKMTKPNGKTLSFEYDNIITDRIINRISKMGLSNQIRYDSNNNPILTRIVKNNFNGDLKDGLYKIRLKGTDKYFDFISNQIIIKSEDCNHTVWNFEKVENYYRISHSILNNKFLSIKDDCLIISNESNDDSLFELKKNNNGSFLIKLKSKDKYLKYNNSVIEVDSLVEENYCFEFYIETIDSDLFIENKAEYTEDGKFIEKTVDSLGNITNYDTNNLTGLVTSETNANGYITNYTYNDKHQLIRSICCDKKTEYQYNDNNLLSKVKHGNKEYNFNYDEFGNVLNIKIGNNITLVTNNYDSTGELKSFSYGNNSSVLYEYDRFYRLIKMTKENNVYNYKYNNSGELIKILSNSDTVKYTYDLSKRLSEYKFNDFKVKYKYDVNDNIIENKYILNDISNITTNTYNDDDLLTEVEFENKKIKYSYDSLGRLIKGSINDSYDINYNYSGNGKNTSMMVKKIDIGICEYTYKYDKMNNITHIYVNDNLICKYYYDSYNQLLKEIDFESGIITKYNYDQVGNILSKCMYKLETLNFIGKDTYKYSNCDWEDQLTKFNDKVITYDEIGNPLTIGNEISLNWVNGRELESYNNNTNLIKFKYNIDGIRTSKIVNNIETKYYLEGTNIIFEKTEDDILFFLYNDIDELYGFKYNNNVYYYLKNIQNDIVGILDNNYNLVAKYKYDAWGKIMTITDMNGNDVLGNNTHIANINPFRYRSYYYDKETELYYLNERYYNPNWRRFINSDSYGGQVGGNILLHNIYAYSLNNPIKNNDDTGMFANALFGALVGIGALLLAPVIKKAAEGVGKLLGSTATTISTSRATVKPKVKTKTVSKSQTRASISQLSRAPSRPCAPASSTFGTVRTVAPAFTIQDAINYINSRGTQSRDVVCINRSSAQAVAMGVSPKYYEDEAHRRFSNKFFPHFHDGNYPGHVHIWYYIIP